jgi:hypothetical protein
VFRWILMPVEGMACPYFEDEDVAEIKKMRMVPWK